MCSPQLVLASFKTNTKHFVVTFLLTHKLVFSMLISRESKVLSPHHHLEKGNRRGGVVILKPSVLIRVAAILLVITWVQVNTPAMGSNGSSGSGVWQGREWVSLTGEKTAGATVDDRQSRMVVAESSGTALGLKVFLPGMHVAPTEMADGKVYTAVTTPGSGLAEKGKPAVPLFGKWIMIPNGSGISLDITPGPPSVFENISVPPVQQIPPDLEHFSVQPFIKDAGVYDSDQDYPGVFARLEPIKIIRGQECTILWLYPFQHNPVKKTLAVYPDLSVTVRFDGEPLPIPERLRSKAFETVLNRMVVNASDVIKVQETAEKALDGATAETGPVAPQGCCNYIIITTNEFSPAAYKLAAWKRKIGFQTMVVPTSSPTAADIKSFLQWCYDSLAVAPMYVLIIGDADDIPCNYETLHPYENMVGGKDTQGYVGTDLYYATLAGTDYMPDIYIGRLPVDSASDALDNVDRIIEYEQDPPTTTNFYDKVALCAYFQDGMTPLWEPDGIEDSRFAQTSEDLAIFFSSATYGIGKTVNRIYAADATVTPVKWSDGAHLALPNFGGGPAGNPGDNIPSYLQKPGFPWNGDHVDITGAFQDGHFLITHRDHGGRQYWVHPYFHSAHVGSLQIRWGEYPVVWSVNCQTGWFDNETDFQKHPVVPDPTGANEESLAEFLGGYCALGGPVGIMAATRVTDTIYNDRLMWGWTDVIWPDFIADYPPLSVAGIYRMGQVMNSGKYYLASTVPDDDWRKTHFEAYHWFGDPAMEIRTEHPDWLTAKIPAVWPWKGKSHDVVIPVQDTAGPLQHATVTISHPSKTYNLWSITTDANGNAPFKGLLTTESGAYDVVATASNCVPYEGTFNCFGKEASWCAGHTWWWSDPTLGNTYGVDSDRATITVGPYQDMWSCTRGQAPMLYFHLPETGSWVAQVKLSVPVLNPDTMAGLALWDGNELGAVHALYLGLINAWNFPWVLVEGSTPENCAGIYGNVLYANTQVYLRIRKSGNRYAFSYKSDGGSWTDLGPVSTTAAFTRLGFMAKSWNTNGLTAEFSEFRLLSTCLSPVYHLLLNP